MEIRAAREQPLILHPVQFDLDGKVRYTIEEIEKGKRFRLCFENAEGPTQTYQGILKLKTNYPEKPELTIPIRGHFVVPKND